MIILVRIVGTVVALGLAALSVAMTFAFGMAFSDGAESYIYAGIFALMDMGKFVLPTIAGGLILKGAISKGRIARFLYLVLAVMSGSTHVGLTLMVKDAETSVSQSSQTRLTDATAARDALKVEIAGLKDTRSAGKIEAEVAQIERDPIFTDEKKSNHCANDTADASRKLCDRWRVVKGERDDRIKLDRLEKSLTDAQAKVDGLNNPGALKKANILAVTLAEKTGTTPTTVLLIIAIIMAALIEACSSMLLELVMFLGHKEPAQTITPLVEPEPLASAPLIAQNDVETRDIAPVIEDSRPVMDAKEWVASRMQPRKGQMIDLNAVLDTYAAEAESQGMAAANKNMFGRALTANGYDRKRKGTVTMIQNAVVKSERANLRVV